MEGQPTEKIFYSSSNFEQHVKTEENDVAIVLIDSSGSTQTAFSTKQSVFEKLCSLVKEFPHEKFRIIFWSSRGHNRGNFVNGVMCYPHVILKKNLDTIFTLAKSCADGSTQPNIGFAAIDPEWKKGNPLVYFLTDGQYDKNCELLFTEQIRSLGLRLKIIAVENRVVDMTNLEQAQRGAGGDVYRLIQNNGLTKMVMSFVSHNPAGSFVQINRVEPPKGYIPFGDQFFSELVVSNLSLLWPLKGFANFSYELIRCRTSSLT